MASDCPVCGERLADGVLSRSYPEKESKWLDDLIGPVSRTQGGPGKPETPPPR